MIKILYNKIKYGVPSKINRIKFSMECSKILKSEPIKTTSDDFLIVSVVSHRDLLMYLAAAKSFHYYFKKGTFIVINDRSLTSKDIGILKEHIQGISIVEMDDIDNKHCPEGGTWERLLYASDVIKDTHVIIMDADILTKKPVTEIAEWLEHGKSFIMAAHTDSQIDNMKNLWIKEKDKLEGVDLSKAQFQATFDYNIDKIPDFENIMYVRGTSGFHAYTKNSFTREKLEEFSQKMENIFKEKWHLWGSEQIMACLMVSNLENSIVLPVEKYATFYTHSDINYDNCSLIHYIGINRFEKGVYIKDVQSFIHKYNNKIT